MIAPVERADRLTRCTFPCRPRAAWALHRSNCSTCTSCCRWRYCFPSRWGWRAPTGHPTSEAGPAATGPCCASCRAASSSEPTSASSTGEALDCAGPGPSPTMCQMSSRASSQAALRGCCAYVTCPLPLPPDPSCAAHGSWARPPCPCSMACAWWPPSWSRSSSWVPQSSRSQYRQVQGGGECWVMPHAAMQRPWRPAGTRVCPHASLPAALLSRAPQIAGTVITVCAGERHGGGQPCCKGGWAGVARSPAAAGCPAACKRGLTSNPSLIPVPCSHRLHVSAVAPQQAAGSCGSTSSDRWGTGSRRRRRGRAQQPAGAAAATTAARQLAELLAILSPPRTQTQSTCARYTSLNAASPPSHSSC